MAIFNRFAIGVRLSIIVFLCVLMTSCSFGGYCRDGSISSSSEGLETNVHVFANDSAQSFMTTLNAIVVKWGEQVEYLDTSGYSAYAVSFVKVYDATVTNQSLGELRKKLNAISLQPLIEKYDDIIRVPNSYDGKITEGDISLVFVDNNEYACVKDLDYRICVFPFDETGLVVYEFWNHFAFIRANREIKNKDVSLPIFQSGISIEELEVYFNEVTKKELYD